jgi:hypothetical protein
MRNDLENSGSTTSYKFTRAVTVKFPAAVVEVILWGRREGVHPSGNFDRLMKTAFEPESIKASSASSDA